MEERVPEIGDRLRTLAHHKLVIVVTVGGLVAAALAYSFVQPDRYSATSEVVVQPVVLQPAISTSVAGGFAGNPSLDVDIETEALIAGSPLIAEKVLRGLPEDSPASDILSSPGDLADSIETAPVTDDLIEITASAPTPELAALIANSVAEQYLAGRTEAATAVVDAAVESLRVRVRQLDRSIERLDAQIIELVTQPVVAAPVEEVPLTPASPTPGALSAAASAAERKAEIDRLRAERDQSIIQLGALRARYGDLLAASAASIAAGQIVQRAVAPESPDSPQPIRLAAVALLIGLILGVALALGLERLRDRIRTRDDAAESAHAPVLAAIPKRMLKRRPRKLRLAVVANPSGVDAQAYRTLRANLMALSLGGDVRSLVIASADRGSADEAVANLAAAIANAGIRVLVLSAFVRGSRLPAFLANGFRLSPDDVGLSSVLTGEASLSAAISQTARKNVLVVRPGEPETWTPDLLASPRFAQLMKVAEETADIVLIEASAVTLGSDATTVAIRADGALLVVRAGEDRKASVARASSALRQASCPPVGVLLLASSPRDGTVGVPTAIRGFARSPADGANGANGSMKATIRHVGVAAKVPEPPPMGGDE